MGRKSVRKNNKRLPDVEINECMHKNNYKNNPKFNRLDILNKCTNKKFSEVYEIAEGSYGKVYSAKMDDIFVAIKINKIKNMEDSLEDIKFNIYMSEAKIGPKIYDIFHIRQEGVIYRYI